MKNTRPSAAVRLVRRWQKFRPGESRYPTDGHEASGEQPPAGKGPRRTLTVIFRAN